MIAKLKLDKRRETKSGEYPIKIYICVGRRTRLVSTGLFVREELFDSVRGEVIGRGQAKFNEKLAMIRRRTGTAARTRTGHKVSKSRDNAPSPQWF